VVVGGITGACSQDEGPPSANPAESRGGGCDGANKGGSWGGPAVPSEDAGCGSGGVGGAECAPGNDAGRALGARAGGEGQPDRWEGGGAALRPNKRRRAPAGGADRRPERGGSGHADAAADAVAPGKGGSARRAVENEVACSERGEGARSTGGGVSCEGDVDTPADAAG